MQEGKTLLRRKADYIGRQCYDDETIADGKFITWILYSICLI